MPLRSPAALAAALLLLTACGGEERTAAPAPVPPPTTATPSAPSAPSPTGEPSPTRPAGDVDASAPQVLATGLDVPWGLAFLPGGDALVTERDTARVLRVPAAGGDPVEVDRLDDLVRPGGEGGLLGIAVSPSYAQDGLVYAYVTAEDDNRIVRFRLGEQPEAVVTGIPKGRIHNGGRLAFGPDGSLYAGTGDTGDTDLAQDDDSLGGKVLRMTPDGEPVAGASSLVLSKGHRNVQGLAFDDAGRLYATEFGQDDFDEVNLLRQGSNGGWPEVEGAGTGGGRFLEPLVVWQPSEASPSGAAVLGDALYVAALRGQRLWRMELDGEGGLGEPQALLRGELGRLRAAAAAPDGSLWLLTNNTGGRGDAGPDDDRVVRLPPR